MNDLIIWAKWFNFELISFLFWNAMIADDLNKLFHY